MLTEKDKDHIREVHKMVEDMERLGVGKKLIDAVVSQKWFCFEYDPDQNFKYIGSLELPYYGQ